MKMIYFIDIKLYYDRYLLVVQVMHNGHRTLHKVDHNL